MVGTSEVSCHAFSHKGTRGWFTQPLLVAALGAAWLHAQSTFAAESVTPRPAPSTSKTAAFNLVPDRVSSHYSILSKGNKVDAERITDGAWKLKLSVRRPARAGTESYAGYCWDINLVNGNTYDKLTVRFTAVERPTDLQFKLEQRDNGTQERVLRLPAVPEVAIPLSNYPAVRPAIARFCLALAVGPAGKTPTDCEVTLTTVTLE
jgi:hypothetical protein